MEFSRFFLVNGINHWEIFSLRGPEVLYTFDLFLLV